MSARRTPGEALAWLRAIREPEAALAWSLPEWERVTRLARRTRLLARLAESIDAAGLMERVPAEPRRHLVAEQRISRFRTASVEWALERIGESLAGLPAPRVLLKGAAYLGQDLPIARGRLPSDVDIMVPRAAIEEAVARLKSAGWIEKPLDDYDRRYYLDWSHEVPPMGHPVHTVELDLHHNILPPVSRTKVNADLLFERRMPSKWDGWSVLDPVDQVLHSAAHLFYDAEFRDRIRDLVDLDGLFRHFAVVESFWRELPARAQRLSLQEPLGMVLDLCSKRLGSPVPPLTCAQADGNGIRRYFQDGLRAVIEPALLPAEPDAGYSLPGAWASAMVRTKYHLWRMPFRLLLPHSMRKLTRAAYPDTRDQSSRGP